MRGNGAVTGPAHSALVMQKMMDGARRAGPYLMVMLLPGGSLLAALMLVSRGNAAFARFAVVLMAAVSLAILAAPVA